MRRLLLVLALLAGGLALAPAPAQAGQTFGDDPLDDVLHWAAQEARCGLTTNKLAAIMLAPTFPETGAPANRSPSPMTLSRYDDQAGLHSFGTVADQPRAFWHPGVGAWQFDSAGLGAPFTAAQRIDTHVVSAQAAATMAARWCTNPTLAYVWAPWYGCGTRTCKDIFDAIYRRNGDRLVNVTRDATVHRTGGMEKRTCTGSAQAGRFTCWRVDPSRAEGHDAFTANAFGRAPISAPFYVYAANGKEYRHWLRADTGYRRDIWASRPLGTNARTSLTWRRGATLTDVGPAGSEQPSCDGFCDVPAGAWYLDALTWAVDGEVVSGFDDDTFRPTDPVTRAQVVSWLWTLAGRPAAAGAPPYDDVAPSAWYAEALRWASDRGLVRGFPNGTYRPNDPVNRAQFASILWQLAERPAAAVPAPFGDVRPQAWHAPAIAWLAEMGWVAGFPNGTFRPESPVNRAQAVSWLHAARQFDDVSPTAGYAAAVDWARYRRVIEGFDDHTFRGDLSADRATTVGLLWQLMDGPAAAPHAFPDVAAGDPAVSWAAATGVAGGFPNGTFRPAAPVNRAQAVMMLWNVAGRPTVAGSPPFGDVAATAWYAPGLTWAAARGLVGGFGDGTFRATDAVSRTQLTSWASALAHAPGAWAPGVSLPTTVVA